MPELGEIRKKALSLVEGVDTLPALEAAEIEILGRKSELSTILRSVKDAAPEERKIIGREANELRKELEELFVAKRRELGASPKGDALKKERLDVTRPGKRLRYGHLHPITRLRREVEDIFVRMGFTVAEGPQIETEHYNFDALNIPADHPARDMWDTFWLKEKTPKNEKLLLRTHTSPVQIRYMETHEPPVRIIVPGLVYRYEATDASHDIQFWQLEGLMVDRDVSVSHFKAVIERFFTELFKTKVTIRLRPSFFPFVEPGFEVDISCAYCKGKGCSVCGNSGWLELMGAGIVHPNVLKAVGYNPRSVQGFAFGMGLDRLALMKYKIPDIRLMRSGDLRFLNQF